MSGFLRFLLFTSILVLVVVVVVVPLVAGPFLASVVRQAGLDGDDIRVGVDLLGPSVLSGRAPGVRIEATNVGVPRATITELDITLRGVSVFDRSFEGLSGTLAGLEVAGPGGEPIHVASVVLEGPAEATLARGRLEAPEAERLIRRAIEQEGVPVDRVTLGDDVVSVASGGIRATGRLRVAGGALLLETGITEPLVLIAPATSESWRLEAVRVEPAALTVDVVLDAAAFWERSSELGG